MKFIKRKKITEKNETQFFGVVKATEWFGDKLSFPVLRDDYILGEWHDYHDGTKSNVEGKLTLAVCRVMEDATTLFEKRETKK